MGHHIVDVSNQNEWRLNARQILQQGPMSTGTKKQRTVRMPHMRIGLYVPSQGIRGRRLHRRGNVVATVPNGFNVCLVPFRHRKVQRRTSCQGTPFRGVLLEGRPADALLCIPMEWDESFGQMAPTRFSMQHPRAGLNRAFCGCQCFQGLALAGAPKRKRLGLLLKGFLQGWIQCPVQCSEHP